MRKNRIVKGFGFVLLAFIVVVTFGFAVRELWNWLMPEIFGLRMITFWQAAGLVALTRFLFGRLPGDRGPRTHWRRRMAARWDRMTPEERERFQQGMQARCGKFGAAANPATE
jgi:hypothetical protein